MRLTAALSVLAVLLAGCAVMAQTIPGDLNGDGIADRNDLPLFIQAWRNAHAGSGWASAADMNGDHVLDHLDVDLFLRAFLAPAPAPAYRLESLCFGPYYHADASTPPTVADLQWLVDGAAPYCRRLRTFSSAGNFSAIAPYAKSRGLGVWAGCDLTGDAAHDAGEINALIALINQGVVDVAVVGNENLLAGGPAPLQPSTLIAYINQVRAQSHGVPVTTAQSWHDLIANPDVVAACDVIMANAYSFWETIPVDHAIAVLNDHYNDLVAAYPGKPVYIGEVGWPSGGSAYGAAVPSPTNAAAYFLNFVSWARARGVQYTYFEMIDEPYKLGIEGDVGPHWGLWQYSTTDGASLKPGMILPFRGQTVPDNWTAPSIFFTGVPAYGDTTNTVLYGDTTGINPAQYDVAVYIHVVGLWWPKPTYDTPLTALGDGKDPTDRSWNCQIVTGGSDQDADIIYAFLLPVSYTPPKQSTGLSAIPQEVFDHAIVQCSVNRGP